MLRLLRAGISILFVVLFLPGLSAQALANKLTAKCDRGQFAAASEVQCDIRGTNPGEYEKFEVKLDNGRSVDVVGYDPFNFKLRTSAYLFLIQRSGHPRDASTAIEQLLKFEGKRAAGVYTFADGLEEHAKLGSSEGDIKKALAKTKNKVERGARTPLYSSIREAAQRLGVFSADRKAIVLFSDGRSVESYTEKEAIEEARKNNVVIYTVAMTGPSEGSANLVNLRHLADETNGVFVDAGSTDPHTLPAEFVSKFYDYLENGGLLKLKGSNVPDNASLVIAANLIGTTTSPLKTDSVSVGSGTEGSIWAKVKSTWRRSVNWTTDNPIPAAAFAIAALGLLVVGYNMVRRGRLPAPIFGAPSETDDDFQRTSRFGRTGNPTAIASSTDTVILTPMNDRGTPDKVYAWLQFLDATSTRVPIGATNVRIGRHKDNDICLQNNSVHRQHAVLHMSHDRKFVIRDLGTTNGVVVNSQRINQKELSDGDLIELGEVRARFFANPEAAQ